MEEVIVPDDAVILVVPLTADAVANPVLEMIATFVSEDVQVTELLMSLVVPSANTATAENC